MSKLTQPRTLLDAVAATGAGEAIRTTSGPKTVQANVVGTGAVGATVKIQVGNIPDVWEDLATITLSGTTSDSDGLAWTVPWAYCRADCTAISGTGARLTVALGEQP